MTTINSIQDAHALIGRQTKQRFRMGDRIVVQVARVDKLLRRAYLCPQDRRVSWQASEGSR